MLILEYIGLDLDIDDTVDGYVANFARNNNRTIIGFEGILEQAQRLWGVPLEIQHYALIDFPDFETLLAYITQDDGLVDAYRRQDLDAIRALLYVGVDNDDPYSQHFRHIMWDERCRIYADGIAELLRNTTEPTTFFFTFGISHIMGGNAGIVLELLADMGFDLIPLWQQQY